MGDFERIQFGIDEGVATITLNRPGRLNALDTATIRDMNRAIDVVWDSPEARCLVLTGSGRGFCAGADVKEWSETAAGAGGDDWVSLMHRFMSRYYRLPKPAVALVNGVAVGAGFDLVLAADVRVVSHAARFGAVYVNLGFAPDAGTSFLLPRLVGQTRATELIFTGRIVEAAEAHEMGLVTELVEPDDLAEAGERWARQLASGPTVALGLAKENIRENATLSLESALRNERRAGEICGSTADHEEGLRAVIEKRAPAFVGR
jgi:2-(1,2-epoxy-1,2-dihydrophenyl)acetyl-CoA isomerase